MVCQKIARGPQRFRRRGPHGSREGLQIRDVQSSRHKFSRQSSEGMQGSEGSIGFRGRPKILLLFQILPQVGLLRESCHGPSQGCKFREYNYGHILLFALDLCCGSLNGWCQFQQVWVPAPLHARIGPAKFSQSHFEAVCLPCQAWAPQEWLVFWGTTLVFAKGSYPFWITQRQARMALLFHVEYVSIGLTTVLESEQFKVEQGIPSSAQRSEKALLDLADLGGTRGGLFLSGSVPDFLDLADLRGTHRDMFFRVPCQTWIDQALFPLPDLRTPSLDLAGAVGGFRGQNPHTAGSEST